MALNKAASEVFVTAELLEQILSNLTIDRLLVMKRVNRYWNAVINTSPTVQRILFLRADTTRENRGYNPLFEDYFDDIGLADASSSANSKGPPAHLKINPIAMRKLLHRCPKEMRSMTMFQPPCRYWITMASASVFDITVKFVNEPHVPVMQAVEQAALIVELEADKKRHLRRNLERDLAAGVRGAGMRRLGAAINA